MNIWCWIIGGIVGWILGDIIKEIYKKVRETKCFLVEADGKESPR